MRKILFMLLLAVAVFATGCGNGEAKTSQETKTTEAEKDSGKTTEEDKDQVDQDSGEKDEQDSSSDDADNSLNDYMASVKEQADAIKASLENDELTQQDMNLKSEELYKLWDDALNYLWGELKNELPEEEFEKLLNEQRVWIKDKETAVEEAGKEAEGGSMYPLIINSKAAEITEERVLVLYGLLK